MSYYPFKVELQGFEPEWLKTDLMRSDRGIVIFLGVEKVT
jgi:hypothetical protein